VEKWPPPRAVQIGAVDAYKVDVDLAAALADARPDWQLVMVGPIGLGQPTMSRRLPQRPNLHWMGPVDKSRVPAILAGADAGLLLHRQNTYTAFSEPIKLREYQAAGIPTVTTLPQWRREPGVLVGSDVDELAFALDQVREWTVADRRTLACYGAQFSWTRRMADVEELLGDAHRARRA
jgi:glycosyltransferase involved in cell wall biosynthesis